MPTTSNFGWTTPADTDLVKDGAAAIRTLGNGIDTSLVDLKGGTTGQVLAKATNTDLDFTWVAQDDSNAIQNAIVDAKGDLITATAADVPARLASSGVNGDVLTVDTTTATGLKWAASSSVSAATQSELEAASSTTVYTSPGRQQFHPSSAKFWVYFTGTGTPTIQASYNMTSITDNGTGYYTINIGTDFSSGNYALVGNCEKLAGASTDATLTSTCFVGAYQTGDFGILTATLNGTLVDSGRVFCAGYGDQ